jgi:hypothetical protein
MAKDYLILKRASLCRPSGQWNEEDYDVLANGEVFRRIFKANAAPVGLALVVDLSFRAPRGSNADARLCRSAGSRVAERAWHNVLRYRRPRHGPG